MRIAATPSDLAQLRGSAADPDGRYPVALSVASAARPPYQKDRVASLRVASNCKKSTDPDDFPAIQISADATKPFAHQRVPYCSQGTASDAAAGSDQGLPVVQGIA